MGVITLNQPSAEIHHVDSYAELRDLFRGLKETKAVRAIVLTGATGRLSVYVASFTTLLDR